MVAGKFGAGVINHLRKVSLNVENVWHSPGALTNPGKSLGWRRPAAGILKAVDLPLALISPKGRTLEGLRARLMGVEESKGNDYVDIEDEFGAHNYHPLPVVIERGEGVWVFDVKGKRYLDCLSAYSALNYGYNHPRIIEALRSQGGQVALTSRAFRNTQLPLLERELCQLSGYGMMLPMNTGAEAVETAIKTARKWAYLVKGIPQDQAEIVACQNNFHGRTVTIVSFSTDPTCKKDYGPYTPGFVTVPFGDPEALEKAITPRTAAFLVEPIQAEAGILVPPPGYLKRAEEICRKNNVLLITDEIQTGLGRTGKLFAFQHEGVRPDVVVIGKSLGGGVVPISAVLSSREILLVFKWGEHGSTFGGNPLACAVARESLRVLVEERMAERAVEQGQYLLAKLKTLKNPHIKEIRGVGLLIGIELFPMEGHARRVCEALAEAGVLCKETHDDVIRLAPPLNITREELDWAFARIEEVFRTIG